jgi:bZIP transcription factor
METEPHEPGAKRHRPSGSIGSADSGGGGGGSSSSSSGSSSHDNSRKKVPGGGDGKGGTATNDKAFLQTAPMPTPKRVRSDGKQLVGKGSLRLEDLIEAKNRAVVTARDDNKSVTEDDRKAQKRAANRLSAFQCRQRRKVIIEDLQRTVAQLSRENTSQGATIAQLKGQLDASLKENEQLRSQIVVLAHSSSSSAANNSHPLPLPPPALLQPQQHPAQEQHLQLQPQQQQHHHHHQQQQQQALMQPQHQHQHHLPVPQQSAAGMSQSLMGFMNSGFGGGMATAQSAAPTGTAQAPPPPQQPIAAAAPPPMPVNPEILLLLNELANIQRQQFNLQIQQQVSSQVTALPQQQPQLQPLQQQQQQLHQQQQQHLHNPLLQPQQHPSQPQGQQGQPSAPREHEYGASSSSHL